MMVTLDYYDRQVYHKFEPISKPEVQLLAPSQKIDCHKLRISTSDAMAAVCTLEEVEFYNRNEDKINKQKLKSLQKEEIKVC